MQVILAGGSQQIQGFVFEKDEFGVTRIGLQKQSSDTKIMDAVKVLLGVSQ